MSVYRKDDNGNIKKIAGSLTQRINMHIFQTTHEFDTVKNEDNYIINESDAKPYISSIKDWTQYSINLSEPNQSSNINIKLGSQTLKLINNVKNIEIGTLKGVIQCHTEKLDNNEIFLDVVGTVVSLNGVEKTSINTDTTPTANSNNLITSGGVHDYPAIVFAESERQKSKNLFDLNYNGTFNSTTETSVSKYIALKSVYGEKFTINTNLPQYSFSRGSVGDIYTNIIFKNLKPNTSYTISFTPISVDNGVVHFLGVYNVQDKLNTKVTKTITTDENGRFDTGYGIWISAQNTTFVVKDIQAEEGSTATDYQPYYGQITHNGDPAVEFAESERQKSKNLLQNTLEGFQLENKGYDLVIYQRTKQVTYPLYFSVKGNTIDYPLSPEGALFQFTYSDGSVSYITGTYFQSDTKQCANYTFNGSKELEKITLLNWCQCIGTVEFAQLEENNHFTGYQPYNGAIVHEKEFHESLQNTPAIVFAESERQKSKNLFSILKTYSITHDDVTITINSDTQKVLINGTASSAATISFSSDEIAPISVKNGEYFTISKTPNVAINVGINNKENPSGSIIYVNKTDKFNTNTIIQNDKANRLYFWYEAGDTFNNVEFGIQVEEGSTATDYQPYNGEIIHEKKLNEIVNGKYPIDINACTTYDQVYNSLQNATYGQCGIGVNHTNAIKSLLPTFPTNASYVDCVANIIKNKYTSSVNIYAIRFTGCPFGMNQPIYYCDVFYDGQSTIVTGWYKPIAVELIYDKDTKSTIGGTTYTNGIGDSTAAIYTVNNIDLTPYKYMYVYQRMFGEIQKIFVDLTNSVEAGGYCGGQTTMSYNIDALDCSLVKVPTTKNSITFDTRYIKLSDVSIQSTPVNVCRIEGYK